MGQILDVPEGDVGLGIEARSESVYLFGTRGVHHFTFGEDTGSVEVTYEWLEAFLAWTDVPENRQELFRWRESGGAPKPKGEMTATIKDKLTNKILHYRFADSYTNAGDRENARKLAEDILELIP